MQSPMQSPSRSGNSNGSGSAAVGPVFEGLSVFEPKDEWSRLCGTVRRTTTHLAYRDLDLDNDTPCLEVAQKSIDGSTFCSCCLTRVGRSVNEIRCIPVWSGLVWSGLIVSCLVLSCLVLFGARLHAQIDKGGGSALERAVFGMGEEMRADVNQVRRDMAELREVRA
jgi:hypothetical protein